jgi:hypothetical protein
MGGGPDTDELLITLPLPPAAFPVEQLKKLYPDINVTYVQLFSDKEAGEEPKKSELKGSYASKYSVLEMSGSGSYFKCRRVVADRPISALSEGYTFDCSKCTATRPR